jgi:hypothetical protein
MLPLQAASSDSGATARTRESGQAVVFTVLFLTALLAAAAAVIDVGSWYRADRALQSTVDAAALAAAQALPRDVAEAHALAEEYAAKNGGGLESVSISSNTIANDTVEVQGAAPAPGHFSRVFGIDSVTVRATAVARAFTMGEARWASPFGVDEQHPMLQCQPSPCFGQATTLELEKVGPGAFRLLNIDGSYGGTSPVIVGDWIRHGYEGYMPLGWYYSDPGTRFNAIQIRSALEARVGQEALFPVYRATRGQGANFEYEVVAWVGFRMTSFTIQGAQNSRLHGHFTSIIWEGIGSEAAEETPYGAHTISLVG